MRVGTMELVRKVGLFGLKDLRKLAPIGDLDYMNGWSSSSCRHVTWAEGELCNLIHSAFLEQQKIYGWKVEGWSSGYRQTDHHTRCPELGLMWSVDSGD